jgi:hypothetical protein
LLHSFFAIAEFFLGDGTPAQACKKYESAPVLGLKASA